MLKEIKIIYNPVGEFYTICLTYKISFKIVEKRYTISDRYKKVIDIISKIFEELDEYNFELLLIFIDNIMHDYYKLKKEEKELNGKR